MKATIELKHIQKQIKLVEYKQFHREANCYLSQNKLLKVKVFLDKGLKKYMTDIAHDTTDVF